jgi:PAS domain S-box-containing protein
MRQNLIISEQSNQIISNIYRISSLLTEPSLIEKVLTSIMETVKYDLGFDRSTMFLINKEKMLLECKFISGFTDKQENIARSKPFNLQLHDCIETKVALLGKPILVVDFDSDTTVTNVDKIVTANLDRGCTLYVPLKVKGEIIGILGVDKKRGEAVMAEQEIESLSIFANFASIVIENSRLYEDLLKEKNFSENILNSSINGILTTDIRGRITSLNPAAEEILGIKKEQVHNSSLQEIFNSIPEIEGMLSKTLIERERIKGYENTFKRCDGTNVILNISSSPIIDDDGNLLGTLLLIEDITSERKRDEYLQRMSRLISLGELAAGVAHEIRNPLTGIGVVLDILKNRQRLSKSDKNLLDDAMQEIERLEKIVSDLLAFARPKAFNFEMVGINDIIKSIYFLISEQCNNQNIKLITRHGRRLPKSLMDQEKIRQGLLNIVINAIQAMPRGGDLGIETACQIIKDNGNEEKLLVITISDTGSGIPELVKDRIFDPFFTTHTEGTGLGLSITHSIIKEHRGTIKFESEEGKGTNFIVSLPIVSG